MKAIILAAGRGRRMLPFTKKRPKCLLPFGNKTILEYQLDLFKQNGISEIIIVNGFAAEQIEKVTSKDITYVYNRHYLSTNSLYSLFLAREHLDSDILLLNADVLFHEEIMKGLIEEQCPNAIAVDFEKPLMDDEMNVRVSNGYVVEIGKNIPLEKADGESVQLAKFGIETIKELRNEIIRLIEDNQLDKFPTEAYKPIIENYGLKAVDIQAKAWAEVDTIEDYMYVCNELYKKLIDV
jgi:choline kinase